MTKKKIILISNSFKGLYLFRKELIDSFSNTYDVTIVAPSNGNEKLFESQKISIEKIKLSLHGTNPFKELRALWQLKKLIKKNNPDFIFTFTIKPNLYVGLLNRFMKFQFIPNVSGQGRMGEKKGIRGLFFKLIYHFAFKKTKTVFFQNQRDLEEFRLRKIVNNNASLLPGSGVNLSYFMQKPYPSGKEIHFLFVGRIIKEKGIDYYLRLAEEYKSVDAIFFHVVGPMTKPHETRIDEMSKANIIVYHGEIDDVRSLYEKCHCLIHPTYYAEGMSNVLLEASATGRPVIATIQPGTKETFLEGISGFGFKARAYHQLKNAVVRFISLSHEEKAQMGQEARNYVSQKFDRKIIIDKYSYLIT